MGSVSTTTTSPPPTAPPLAQQSPWHSPVPYLFGGLAAVLCLIMFSLLMLAFSFRRHSPRRRPEIEGAAHKQGDSGVAEPVQDYEQKILVIMAGDHQPTYLATPVVCANCLSVTVGDGFEEVFRKGEESHEICQKTAEEQMYDHVTT